MYICKDWYYTIQKESNFLLSVKVPNVTDSIQKELSKEITIPTIVEDKHLFCFAIKYELQHNELCINIGKVIAEYAHTIQVLLLINWKIQPRLGMHSDIPSERQNLLGNPNGSF